MTEETLPAGKLPSALLADLLNRAPVSDPRVILGPGIGIDCAVVDAGERLLVVKSDPITFATDEIGEYLVQINANDIATTGAIPRWLMVTLLLPEGQTTPALAESLFEQIHTTAARLGISVIGGHSEVTPGLDRPIAAGTLIGEVAPGALIRADGARPGDRLLLTKGVPIEATSVIAHDLGERLAPACSPAELATARAFLRDPGISVVTEAQVAVAAGRVHAMHDPTEGGLLTALWELARASGERVVFDRSRAPVPELARRLCDHLGIDPLASLASGALLIATAEADAEPIAAAIRDAGIPCCEIGHIEAGEPELVAETAGTRERCQPPARDEIARLFESLSPGAD